MSAQKLDAKMDWEVLVSPIIFELFTKEKADEHPKHIITEAIDNGAGFGVRRLARRLDELPEEASGEYVLRLLDLCGTDSEKQSLLKPYLEHLIWKASELDRHAIMLKVFSTQFAELYKLMLTEMNVNPTEQEWKYLFPVVRSRPELLTAVLERYVAYKPHPPVTLDLLLDETKMELRPEMVRIVRSLTSQMPMMVATLWNVFLTSTHKLKMDDRVTLLETISSANLDFMFEVDDLSAQLLQFLEMKDLAGSQSFHNFFVTLAAQPKSRKEAFQKTASYEKFMERAFEIVLKSPNEKVAFPVSYFVERLPNLRAWVDKYQDGIAKRIDAVKSTDLHRSLSEMLQEASPAVNPQDDLRAKLDEREKEIFKKEQEAATKMAKAQVASQLAGAIAVQAQIAIIQTAYQARIAGIQSSNMSAEEKGKAMMQASLDLQDQISKLQGGGR